MINKFLIIVLATLALIITPKIVLAENLTISELLVSVDRFGTTISVDVPADFTYSENPQNNEIEITLENCRIQFQSYDYVRIPSFSPMFESIEVSSLSDSNSSTLKIKLVDPNFRPVISVSPSLNRMMFSFKSSNLTAKEDSEPVNLLGSFPDSEHTSDLEKATSNTVVEMTAKSDTEKKNEIIEEILPVSYTAEIENPVPIIQIPKIVEKSPEIDDVKIEVDDIPPTEIEESDINEKTELTLVSIPDAEPAEIVKPVPVIEIPKIIDEPVKIDTEKTAVEDLKSIEPEITEPDSPTESNDKPDSEPVPLAIEFPKASLEAIHYSQGGLNKDIIAIEFTDISPTVNYEISETGFVIITMHNLFTPPEILPLDNLKREVNGTIIKSLILTRFTEMGLPALQIKLIGRENINIDIEEMDGMIEIILQIGDE